MKSKLESAFHKAKMFFGFGVKPVDKKSDQHKNEFTELIKELRKLTAGKILSITINPNVNSTLYFDIPSIKDNVDWINLNMFDVQTPERNEDEADFSKFV